MEAIIEGMDEYAMLYRYLLKMLKKKSWRSAYRTVWWAVEDLNL
jgi:hypothetical protein